MSWFPLDTATIMRIDCAALVTHLPLARYHSGNSGNALSGSRLPSRARQQGPHHVSASGSFTKAEEATADVLQSNEMIGHGSRGPKMNCRIPPATKVQKEARICIGMQDGIPDDQ
ncbi:hypothetical protein ACVIWV_005620 [Bradyrhizobium diazoefficiens]|jgi:hypothetical protein|uniref:hypothetical protein n=1 Tax=Bradyrhizobium TaxID=374 RepID=UPI001013D584|nr:hypothetical protein [Bradyrhizobium diazoefficiens]MBR0866316.1 hypothetical protein [Bradyrhizobium diazoefficiens]MBR0890778.1 hypothetical protein [Bradyrhizobium diazoefficiens]MBR0922541.1 hypothetical protein [Bradyrhizobium diazoefficiens]WLA63745.1 hypothetical protein QNN01_36080 [Bradyrhizobium diazoefficiens]